MGTLQTVKWTNTIVSYEDFFKTRGSPSQRDGLSLEAETQFRYMGCHLVQRAGRLLKMYGAAPGRCLVRPQSGVMTGQIILQQFYCQQSLLKHPLLDVAMACTLIAGKVEECYRRVRDIVNVYYWLAQRMQGQPSAKIMDYVSDQYYAWRDRVTTAEMAVLRELGFHVQPRHPTGLMANYLNALDLSDDPRLAQRALNYINDSLRSVVHVCYQPTVIACAVIQMAGEDLDVALPADPHWYEVLDVSRKALTHATTLIRSVYTTQPDHKICLDAAQLASFAATLPAREPRHRSYSPSRPRSRSPSAERNNHQHHGHQSASSRSANAHPHPQSRSRSPARATRDRHIAQR